MTFSRQISYLIGSRHRDLKKGYYETAKDISKTRSIMLSFIEKTAKKISSKIGQ